MVTQVKSNFLEKVGGRGKFKLQFKQECIPVGCVSSAAVAVCWAGVSAQEGGVCPGGEVCLEGRCTPPLWTDRHLWKHNLSTTTVADGNYLCLALYWYACSRMPITHLPTVRATMWTSFSLYMSWRGLCTVLFKLNMSGGTRWGSLYGSWWHMASCVVGHMVPLNGQTEWQT